jgi:glutathione synthase/RimK-type ligase-like ATP-grasp enzyme
VISTGTNSAIANEGYPATPIGLPMLAKMAFDGIDLAPLWNELVRRVTERPGDAAALLDLSTIAHLQGRPHDRLALQSAALELQRVYRQPPDVAAERPLRLLAFMAPGDFMANMPLEFMLEGSSVVLDMVYVLPGVPLPELPEHDVALVAVTESDKNQPILSEITALVRSWQRPVINAPDRIARLTRAGTWELLKFAPDVTIPKNARIDRMQFESISSGEVSIESILDGGGFPIIARPASSHAGIGLVKLENTSAIDAYLCEWAETDFYIAPFVDYRSPDGLFRKYRIALIGGRPFACHMAISQHWMIHYLNADMKNDPVKRAEEAQLFATFDRDFAVRHATAFSAIAERVELEYLPIDCGETKDGRLLVFEMGAGMIVHSMDPPDLFPYKRPQMEKVFKAFQTMLQNVCASHRIAKSAAA